jgi:pimeloyl-ACP methyl ester carboxylesterase
MTEYIMPSIQRLTFSPDDFDRVKGPVLVIHGRHDRSSPYGAGRDWAMRLPNARLISVANAAHVPWIEAPGLVLESIDTFLHGSWPTAADRVNDL